jgi:hypothetical protein
MRAFLENALLVVCMSFLGSIIAFAVAWQIFHKPEPLPVPQPVPVVPVPKPEPEPRPPLPEPIPVPVPNPVPWPNPVIPVPNPLGKDAYVKPKAHVWTFKSGRYIDTKQHFGIWLRCEIVTHKDGFYVIVNRQPDILPNSLFLIRKEDVILK